MHEASRTLITLCNGFTGWICRVRLQVQYHTDKYI